LPDSVTYIDTSKLESSQLNYDEASKKEAFERLAEARIGGGGRHYGAGPGQRADGLLRPQHSGEIH